MNLQVDLGLYSFLHSAWQSHPERIFLSGFQRMDSASLNPPLGAERRGSLSTRTTHPAFLAGLTRLLDTVGAQSEIVNPFAYQTKGEMFTGIAEQFGTTKASEFLSATHSCGLTGQRSFRVSVRTQCGRVLRLCIAKGVIPIR